MKNFTKPKWALYRRGVVTNKHIPDQWIEVQLANFVIFKYLEKDKDYAKMLKPHIEYYFSYGSLYNDLFKIVAEGYELETTILYDRMGYEVKLIKKEIKPQTLTLDNLYTARNTIYDNSVRGYYQVYNNYGTLNTNTTLNAEQTDTSGSFLSNIVGRFW